MRGSYGGLAAIEGDRWNAAFSVPAARLKQHRGDVDALFAEIARENPMLAARLAPRERVGEWLASPLPRFSVRRTWPPAVIPVGNAAAALEPIGGEGMGLAMRSAELAAQMLRARDEGVRLPMSPGWLVPTATSGASGGRPAAPRRWRRARGWRT